MTIKEIKTDELKEYENNPRNNDAAVDQVAASIAEFGFKVPIVVDKDNTIVAGHTRLKAAKKLGLAKVPCIIADDLTPEQIKAFRLADNKTAEFSEWDFEKLETELAALAENGFQMDQFGFELFEEKDGNTFFHDNETKGTLNDDFIIPPFSVFDTKQKYWQDRKNQWLEKTGDLNVSREDVLSGLGQLGAKFTEKLSGGTSLFDPVLCEIVYKWFNINGGKILDPFGGEQTKGVVAGELKLPYFAVEFRNEQVEYNIEKTALYNNVNYYCGDSNNIDTLISERDFNLCFTSPPYYDLEVYSKDDMSALGTYEEFMQQYKNIFSKCYLMLADNSFLVVKIGEIRDKKTGEYRGFVSDNIRIMQEIGFKYYNEIILLNAIATAAVRARRNMATRKVTKVHQNILVFYKGELKDIRSHYSELSFDGLNELEEIENE